MGSCLQLLLGQPSVDSLRVFQGSYPVVDSIVVGSTGSGQTLKSIHLFPTNDICGTVFLELRFEGCQPAPSLTLDTTLVLGYPARRLFIVAVWDTSSTCAFPSTPLRTDSMLWDNCTPLSTKQPPPTPTISLYPNPCTAFLRLAIPPNLELQALELAALDGKVLRRFGAQERRLEVLGIERGLYLLRMQWAEGQLVRLVVIL